MGCIYCHEIVANLSKNAENYTKMQILYDSCVIQVLYRPPHKRYTNTISKASLAVYGTWFALIVKTDDYEGEFYPETRMPTYKDIRSWIKQRYGLNVNSASITQTKKKYGLTADTEGRYVQKVRPENEAAIREALIWFGILKRE